MGKLTKKEKRAIMERHGTADTYTEEQWGRLMWAGHSEVSEIMREISVEKGLIAHYRRSQKLPYEQWFNDNEQWLIEYAAETGADFDMEKFKEEQYEQYLKQAKEEE